MQLNSMTLRQEYSNINITQIDGTLHIIPSMETIKLLKKSVHTQ